MTARTYFVHKETFDISNSTPDYIPLSSLKTPAVFKYNKSGGFAGIRQPETTVIRHYADSEFQQKNGLMQALIVPTYTPAIFPNHAIVWTKDSLNESFNPLYETLRAANTTVEYRNVDNEVLQVVQALTDAQEEVIQPGTSIFHINKALRDLREDPKLLEKLSQWKLNDNHIGFADGGLTLDLPQLVFEFEGFYLEADLFKVWGIEHQQNIWNLRLESTRVIKETADNAVMTKKGARLAYIMLDGQLTEVRIRLRDIMHRMPPASGRGLANQVKVFGCDVQKMDIETQEVANAIGVATPSDIKANMALLLERLPETAIRYAAIDVFATHALSLKQKELMDTTRKLVGLSAASDIKDTAGSNVAAVLKDAVKEHFKPQNADEFKLLNRAIAKSSVRTLMNVSSNKFGHQPLDTAGGLLYSRVAKFPHIVGDLGDLDEKSCYATMITSMNFYEGQKIIRSYKRESDKPRMLEAIEEMKAISPRDGWYLRVTGKFNKAINTLVESALGFEPKKKVFKDLEDKLTKYGSKSVLGGINAAKVSKTEGGGKILHKEVRFGVVSAETWDAINLLPGSFVEEYANLKVDAAIYVPYRLIVDNLEEMQALQESLPDDDKDVLTEVVDGKQRDVYLETKANVCLRFPAEKFYSAVKEERDRAKKAGEPIQEVQKLVLNATYGATACPYLPANDKLASNIITASARATSWMMINFCNGFQVITDGCQFSWNNIAVGYKFKEIVEANPEYLLHFDPTIKAKLDTRSFNNVVKPEEKEVKEDVKSGKLNIRQLWIDRKFQEEMGKFYQTNETECRPLGRFRFDLKQEKYNGKELTEFQEFYNTGAGNYVKVLTKGLAKGDVLQAKYESEDSTSDERNPQVTVMKARAYRTGNADVSKWYCDSINSLDTPSKVLHETNLLSLTEACEETIATLKYQPGTVVVPLGFEVKTPKLMKLITHSQFVFATIKQYESFIKLEEELLKKTTSFLLTEKHWKTLTDHELTAMGFEGLKLDPSEMVSWVKTHSVGFGFECLAWCNSRIKTVAELRTRISETIQTGSMRWDDLLKLNRNISKLPRERVLVLTELTIRRWLAKQELRATMRNSISQPTLMQASNEDISTVTEQLEKLMGVDESDWE